VLIVIPLVITLNGVLKKVIDSNSLNINRNLIIIVDICLKMSCYLLNNFQNGGWGGFHILPKDIVENSVNMILEVGERF